MREIKKISIIFLVLATMIVAGCGIVPPEVPSLEPEIDSHNFDLFIHKDYNFENMDYKYYVNANTQVKTSSIGDLGLSQNCVWRDSNYEDLISLNSGSNAATNVFKNDFYASFFNIVPDLSDDTNIYCYSYALLKNDYDSIDSQKNLEYNIGDYSFPSFSNVTLYKEDNGEFFLSISAQNDQGICYLDYYVSDWQGYSFDEYFLFADCPSNIIHNAQLGVINGTEISVNAFVKGPRTNMFGTGGHGRFYFDENTRAIPIDDKKAKPLTASKITAEQEAERVEEIKELMEEMIKK